MEKIRTKKKFLVVFWFLLIDFFFFSFILLLSLFLSSHHLSTNYRKSEQDRTATVAKLTRNKAVIGHALLIFLSTWLCLEKNSGTNSAVISKKKLLVQIKHFLNLQKLACFVVIR
jgi:hypothetical protein